MRTVSLANTGVPGTVVSLNGTVFEVSVNDVFVVVSGPLLVDELAKGTK
jgi:hypothetical protein